MRKFIVGFALALCGLVSPAVYAQDYCCPTDCCEPCGYQGFEGFYVGGNLGAFTNIAHRNDVDGFFFPGSPGTTVDTEVTVGVQIGYDWLCNNAVFGLVADWSWVNNNGNLPGSTNHLHNKTNWYTTIRGRAGLNVCDTLLYVTGGAVVTKFDIDWYSAALGTTFTNNHTRWGWVGGFGAEYLFWCNWSFGVEFLFLELDTTTNVYTSPAGVKYHLGHGDQAYVGRFVLNYRFGDLCGCFW